MQAGAGIRNSMRLLAFLIIGGLLGVSAFAQAGKSRSKPPVVPVNASTAATDVQGVVEKVDALGPNPDEVLPLKQNAAPAVRTPVPGGGKKSVAATAKPPVPVSDEPITAVVPPPATASTTSDPGPATAKSEAPDVPQAYRAEPEPYVPVQGASWLDLGKIIGSVGLVLCMILGGYILIRKFAPQYMAKKPGESNLRLLESLSMGEKRSLSVVMAGGQKFLLANTPGQITLLTALPSTASGISIQETETSAPAANQVLTGSFRSMYEQEKRGPGIRPAPMKALPPDIRGKMQELRKALEG
jgi:flagellar biogenesis protein FliO